MIDRSIPRPAPLASSLISATSLFQKGSMSTPAKARRVNTAVPCLSVHSPGSELSRMISSAMRHLHCAFRIAGRMAVLQNQIELADNERDVGENVRDRGVACS